MLPQDLLMKTTCSASSATMMVMMKGQRDETVANQTEFKFGRLFEKLR